MTLIFRVIILMCLFYRIVNSGKAGKSNKPKETPKEIISLDVDSVNYGPEQDYLKDGASKKIVCKGSHRYQKIDWYDPSGNIVPRDTTKRVFVQDTLAPSLRTKAQALMLVFSRAEVDDSGVWECRSGELQQKVPLCVLDPAEFGNTPEEITMDEGRSITLTCEVKGNPEPKIVWYRDGEELSEDDNKIYSRMKYKSQSFEGQLTIKSLSADDSGIYVCVATQSIPDFNNCSNTIATNITLNVNCAPKFSESGTHGLKEDQPEYIFATINETVELVCDPSAYPIPKFRWFREIGNMLTEYSDKQFKVSDDGTQSVLILVANSSTYNRRFRCSAENDFGEATAFYELKKLVKPLEIHEFSVSDATQDTIVLNITSAVENENDASLEIYPIDGFDIQYLEKNMLGSPREYHWRKGKVHTELTNDNGLQVFYPDITLSRLKPHTEYWVRVRAFNSVGRAPWSFPLLASTTKVEYPQSMTATAASHFGIIGGIILTGAIVLVGGICILIIKRL